MYNIVKYQNSRPIEIIAKNIKSTHNATTMTNALVNKLSLEELEAGFTFKFVTDQDEQFTTKERKAIQEGLQDASSSNVMSDNMIDWDNIGR